jgi:hypothetical protein
MMVRQGQCSYTGHSVYYFIKESVKNSVIAAKNSEIAAKNSEIQNLKSQLENRRVEESENLDTFAGKLYAEKDLADVKIVCKEKTFASHKALLSCHSEVFKTIIRNKSLTEKQAEVMEIEESDFNSEAMEQILFYFYHGKVQNIKKH